MKKVLLSLHPEWAKEIFVTKRKKIEVRKSRPKLEPPFEVLVYQTKDKGKSRVSEVFNSVYGGGKVIGEFVCDGVYNIEPHDDGYGVNQYTFVGADYDDCKTCLSFEKLKEYLGKNIGYAWHISDLKIYDKPKELGEFYTKCDKDGNEMCGDCLYLRVMLNSFPCDDSVDTWCGVDNKKPITRPPQSWCYVEEEK